MRRRILPRILAIGVLVLALAGCVRFQADLSVAADDTVDGSIVVAVLAADETQESRDAALTAVEQIETELLGTLASAPGVTTSDYAEDGYLGSTIRLEGVPLTAFDGSSPDSLRFAHEGDEIVFSGAIDFTGESAPSSDSSDDTSDDLTVAITFPGEVREQNGELSGTTVSWTTTLDQRLEMQARASATPPGPPVLLIAGVAAGVLVLAAIVVVVVVLLVRRGRRAPDAPAAVATVSPDVIPGGPAEAPPADPPVA